VDELTRAYIYRDGRMQDTTAENILEKCKIPGVNDRLGMPEKATLKKAQRESDTNQIINFCALAPNQTKRCLILKALEDMMKENMKEREFSFLDRNYVEEFRDAKTLRQVISNSIV
jgi:hypothetical protein